MRELNKVIKTSKTLKSVSEDLIDASNDYFGIDIMTKTRKRVYSQSRHLLIYYIYTNVKSTHESISEVIGLDQSMVAFTKKKVEGLMRFDKEFLALANNFFNYLDEVVDLGCFRRKNLTKERFIRERINSRLNKYSLSKLRKIDKILSY